MLKVVDGLKQHTIDHETMEIYAENKILILVEEAETSHVNQVYDQDPAKCDKSAMRAALTLLRERSTVVQRAVDAWDLVHVGLAAIRECPASAWVESAKRVNLHPHFRRPFAEWCTRINDFLQVRSLVLFVIMASISSVF